MCKIVTVICLLLCSTKTKIKMDPKRKCSRGKECVWNEGQVNDRNDNRIYIQMKINWMQGAKECGAGRAQTYHSQ